MSDKMTAIFQQNILEGFCFFVCEHHDEKVVSTTFLKGNFETLRVGRKPPPSRPCENSNAPASVATTIVPVLRQHVP